MKRKPRALPVYAVTTALFVGMFGFLGVRVAGGKDPSLGAGQPIAAAPAKRVVVRKVVVTRKIVVIKPAETTAVPVSSGGGGGTSASVSTSAPVASAPAPAPVAAAPAPVQTASS